MVAALFIILAAGLYASLAVAQNVLTIDTLLGDEYLEAQNMGYTVTVVTTAQFSAMTTAQFANYDALILGDPYCDPNEDTTFLNAHKSVWSPAITGNVIIIGSDPSFHSSNGVAGATTFIDDALAFAVTGSSTGLYLALACLYENQAPATEVDFLTGIGSFTVLGAANDNYNDVHLVASAGNLNGLSDTDLSNWYSSVHEVFITYPSDFVPLAIANNAVGQGQRNFGDGSSGVPYLMARGVTPVACGNGHYEPQYGEQCDHSNLNGAVGDTCTRACKCRYGVLDAAAGTCNPPPTTTRTTTTTIRPTTVSSSSSTQSSTYAVTTTQVVGTTTVASYVVTTSTYTSENSTSITTISSSIAVISVFTTSAVTTISPGTGALSQSTTSIARPTFIRSSSMNLPVRSSRVPRPDPTDRPPRPSNRPPPPPPNAHSSATARRPTSTVANHRPNPSVIGTFAFAGCYGSDDNYPGFTLTKYDPFMTLEMCADVCSAHVYAGTYNTDCYCSDITDPLVLLPDGRCDVPCPGDQFETCGGILSPSRKGRRQSVPNGIILSIYNVIGSLMPVATTRIPSSTVSSVTIVPSGNILTTATFLTTSASTIASCPPNAIDCSVGSVTSIIVTATSLGIVPIPANTSYSLTATDLSASLINPATATSNTLAPDSTPIPNPDFPPGSSPGSTTSTCVGMYCDSLYTMEPCTEPLQLGEPVFVRQSCECKGGFIYVPASCDSGSCGNMALYAPVPFTGSAPVDIVLYQPQASDTSPGGVEFVQSDNPTSTGEGSGATPATGSTQTSTTGASTTEASTVVTAGGPSLVVRLDLRILVIYILLVHLL